MMPSLKSLRVAAAALTLLAGLTTAAEATVVSYADRASFEAPMDEILTDTYETAIYAHGDRFDFNNFDIYSDAGMSAVFGETRYQTTGHSNWNILQNGAMCAGCNGSFLMDFSATSLSRAGGVFGVAFDIIAGTDYHAFVTFADGSTADYALAAGFFGLTSTIGIASIHLGLAGGGATTDGYITIDNLSIAAVHVPEPAALALFGLGLLAVAGRRRAA